MEVDSGKEFNNTQFREFFLNSVKVLIRYGQPGRHRQQNFAERAIQEIQKPLLERMNAQEILTGVTSVEWSEDFRDIVNKVDERWQRNSHKIPERPLKIDKKTILLPEGTRVRVKLDEPISVLGKKLHGKFCTGDIRWDSKIRIIKKLMLSSE